MEHTQNCSLGVLSRKNGGGGGYIVSRSQTRGGQTRWVIYTVETYQCVDVLLMFCVRMSGSAYSGIGFFYRKPWAPVLGFCAAWLWCASAPYLPRGSARTNAWATGSARKTTPARVRTAGGSLIVLFVSWHRAAFCNRHCFARLSSRTAIFTGCTADTVESSQPVLLPGARTMTLD